MVLCFYWKRKSNSRFYTVLSELMCFQQLHNLGIIQLLNYEQTPVHKNPPLNLSMKWICGSAKVMKSKAGERIVIRTVVLLLSQGFIEEYIFPQTLLGVQWIAHRIKCSPEVAKVPLCCASLWWHLAEIPNKTDSSMLGFRIREIFFVKTGKYNQSSFPDSLNLIQLPGI